jgi:hypothetical protein
METVTLSLSDLSHYVMIEDANVQFIYIMFICLLQRLIKCVNQSIVVVWDRFPGLGSQGAAESGLCGAAEHSTAEGPTQAPRLWGHP